MAKRSVSSHKLLTPIQDFFHKESASGIVLIIATVLALFMANSGLAATYNRWISMPFGMEIGSFALQKPLILWINDGLMAVFFLLIGLEIKREVLFGELSSMKSASLPLVAAVGGCVVPAVVFVFFNHGTEEMSGWAIPMATDIAFALGILSLLGSRIPIWAKVFLTALAVVDDLIAVLVIALFYTENIHTGPLMVAGVCLVLLFILNNRDIHRLGPYLIIGIVMWFAFLKSGIHATIAGVLLGVLIPGRRTEEGQALLGEAETGVKLFREYVDKETGPDKELLVSSLNYLGDVVVKAEAPLYRLEHKLHGWVAFVIIPIFAFANAGVAINASSISLALDSHMTWGIAAGLFFGKQIGIFGASWIMLKINKEILKGSENVLKTIYGLACLGGIGFTMSLFVGGLAFSDAAHYEMSKIGIMAGSLLSGLVGFLLLRTLPEQN